MQAIKYLQNISFVIAGAIPGVCATLYLEADTDWSNIVFLFIIFILLMILGLVSIEKLLNKLIVLYRDLRNIKSVGILNDIK